MGELFVILLQETALISDEFLKVPVPHRDTWKGEEACLCVGHGIFIFINSNCDGFNSLELIISKYTEIVRDVRQEKSIL